MSFYKCKRGLSMLVVLGATLLVFNAVALAGQEVMLDAAQKERLNTLLSNFSEVLLQPFARGDINDQELIRFGILHNWANNSKFISRKTGAESISAEAVDFAVDKYFGRKISQHQAITGEDYRVHYRDGYYVREPSFFPDFAGQRFAVKRYFTQINALVAEDDGCYTAYGDIYLKEAQSVEIHSLYRPLADWDYRMLSTIQKERPVKATLLSVAGEDGGYRFILLEYSYLE